MTENVVRFHRRSPAKPAPKPENNYINYQAVTDTARVVLSKADLSSGAKVIAIVLAKRTGSRDVVCWPSIRAIAEEAGMSRVSVIRGLKELEEHCLITRTKGAGERRSTTYNCDWLNHEF